MSGKIKQEAISWIKTILLAVILAGAVNSFLIVNAEVPTGSMENTIMTGDHILALRTSYWFSEPEAGDVIVFRYPDDPTGKILYVKTLDEPYILERTEGEFGPYTVPEDSYFMMGDNRNRSVDSRYWDNQFVEKNKILGKVVLRYYKGFKWIS